MTLDPLTIAAVALGLLAGGLLGGLVALRAPSGLDLRSELRQLG